MRIYFFDHKEELKIFHTIKKYPAQLNAIVFKKRMVYS